MEAAGRLGRSPRSHSLAARPPAGCSPLRAGVVITKPAGLLRHRQPQAQIRAWRPAPSVGDHTYNQERLPTRLQTRTDPYPARFGMGHAPPACAFPRPSGQRAPRPPSWWLAGSLCVPPLPTWQEQVKGDAGRGPAAGRASRSSFSTSHLTPARPSAHVLTTAFAPHDPLLGRCCTPTPPRTKVPPAAFDIYSSSYAQNRRVVKEGTILCGARPRARFGTRVAGRCAGGR